MTKSLLISRADARTRTGDRFITRRARRSSTRADGSTIRVRTSPGTPPYRAYTPAMGRIIRRLKQLRFRPFDRGDYSMDGERRVENTDALGAARGIQSPQGGSVPSGYPPGYVPSADEGRPRH